MKKSDISRRNFLFATAKAAPGAVLAATALGHGSAFAADPANPGIKDYTPKYFTEAEWRFLIAACDRLIPPDETYTGAVGANVPVFLDKEMLTEYGSGGLWYMQGPFHPESPPELGYQLKFTPREIYRVGIGDVNLYCQGVFKKDFADLAEAEQIAVLKDLEGGKIALPQIPARAFFAQLLSNVKEGYFADPQYGGNKDMVGWKMIGFPGARADFADWIGQHNQPYPLGPVSIAGKGKLL